MKIRVSAILGIAIGFSFVFSLLMVFFTNPATYFEMNVLGIVTYNMPAMEGRAWILVNYLGVGTLTSTFSLTLGNHFNKNILIVVGRILIGICGLLWLSFGLMAYVPMDDLSINLIIVRVFIILLCSSLSLLFLGIESDEILDNFFLKWYTLFSGALIFFLNFLSLFVYDDDSWIRTNISLFVYFIWFFVFGLACLIQTKKVEHGGSVL